MPIPKKNNDRYRKDNNGKNPKKGYITKKIIT